MIQNFQKVSHQKTCYLFMEYNILSIQEAFKFGEELIYNFDHFIDNSCQHKSADYCADDVNLQQQWHQHSGCKSAYHRNQDYNFMKSIVMRRFFHIKPLYAHDVSFITFS